MLLAMLVSFSKSYSQDSERFLMTTTMNRVYQKVDGKWMVYKTTYASIDIYFDSGRVIVKNNAEAFFASYNITKSVDEKGYVDYKLKSVDNEGIKCVVTLMFDNLDKCFLVSIEYKDLFFQYTNI